MNSRPIPFSLTELLNEARERTLALVGNLDDEEIQIELRALRGNHNRG